MSYILDALKRAEAERERERGAVPSLHAQPMPLVALPDASSAGRRRAVVAASLAVATAAAAAIAWRVLAAPKAAAERVAVAERSAEPMPPKTPVADDDTPSAAAGASPGGTEPAPAQRPNSTAPGATPAPGAERTPASKAGSTARSATDDPGRTPATPVAVARRTTPTGSVPAAAAERAADDDATVDGGERATPVAAAARPPASPSADRIYRPGELPADIRRQLPTLTVGGSMYSESAASRMLILNGQLLHEGDRPAPGVVLEQIEPRRGVLRFKGYRYGIEY